MSSRVFGIGMNLLLGAALPVTIAAQEQPSAELREEYVSTAPHESVLRDELAAIPGKEAHILRFELPAGWVGERHYHTGDVFVYVVEGEFVVDVENEGRKTFAAGDVYHEAVNTVMQARNASTTAATEIIVFQVGDPGEPLMIVTE